mgnify:CR=1 FL=1
MPPPLLSSASRARPVPRLRTALGREVGAVLGRDEGTALGDEVGAALGGDEGKAGGGELGPKLAVGPGDGTLLIEPLTRQTARGGAGSP